MKKQKGGNMGFFKKKEKEELVEDEDDWEDEEQEQPIRKRKMIDSDTSKPQIEAIKRGIEREATQPKYIAVPRAVPTSTMLNEIFDSNQRIEALLIEINKKIDKEIGE